MAEEEKKAAEETKTSAEAPKAKAPKKAKKADGKGKKEGGMMTKVIATVFGAVVAPILVAVGVAYLKPDKSDKPEKTAPTQLHTPVATTKKLEGTIHLVGPNLGEQFYYVAFDPKAEKAVRHEVSSSEVFQYKDSPGRIVVSPMKKIEEKTGEGKTGEEKTGEEKKSEEGSANAVLTTKEEFEDFTLRFWYRWGDKTWPPEMDRARKASILLRAGEDGSWNDVAAWPECVTVFIGDGVCGTIRLNSRPRSLTCQARVKERLGGKLEYLGTEGDPLALESGVDPRLGDHHVPWQNFIFRRGFPEDHRLRQNTPSADRITQAALIGGSPVAAHPNLFGEFAPLGWHPQGDPAIATVKPPYKRGEWNKVIIDCNKDVIRVTVNETLVNEIYGLNLKKGKLGFTSQGAEYEIRQIDVEIKSPEQPEKEPTPVKDTKKGRS